MSVDGTACNFRCFTLRRQRVQSRLFRGLDLDSGLFVYLPGRLSDCKEFCHTIGSDGSVSIEFCLTVTNSFRFYSGRTWPSCIPTEDLLGVIQRTSKTFCSTTRVDGDCDRSCNLMDRLRGDGISWGFQVDELHVGR